MTAARPETGATDADIEEAAKRRAIHEGELNADEEQMEWYRKIYRGHAAILIPPGHVIALAEHVTDAADREAIGRAVESLAIAKRDAREAYTKLPSSQFSARCMEILEALIGATTDADLARMERMRGEGERE